jgi:hypothetical protein
MTLYPFRSNLHAIGGTSRNRPSSLVCAAMAVRTRTLMRLRSPLLIPPNTDMTRSWASLSGSRGWFCFYDNINYGYPRGKLSSCGWQDLATWGWQNRVASAYYQLGNGSTAFLNHVPGTNHAYDQVLFTIDVVSRGIGDVYPYRDMADYMYRSC